MAWLASQATSARPEAVPNVTLSPEMPVLTTIGPAASCSRATRRHSSAAPPARRSSALVDATVVRICGIGASRRTGGTLAFVPSTSWDGGGLCADVQPALLARAASAASATSPRARQRSTLRAPAGSPDPGVARIPPVRPSPDVRAVVLALRFDDLVRPVRIGCIDQPDVPVAREAIHLDQR